MKENKPEEKPKEEPKPEVKQESKEKPKKIKSKISITESKIKALLDFEHLEELFYLINILDSKQIMSFIEHYKNSQIKETNDKKIDAAIRASKTSIELVKSIKKLLADSLRDQHVDIKSKISTNRKKGADMFIHQMKSMSIPLKIKLFEATSDKKDFYNVKKIISEVNTLIEESKIPEEKPKEEPEPKENKLEVKK